MNDLKPALAQLAKDCGARKLVLFGSRARGDNRPRSDIDLAVFGMPEEQQTRFWCGMDDLPTLLKYDVVFVDDYTSPELLAEIDRDGVILYENQTRQLCKCCTSTGGGGNGLSEHPKRHRP